MNISVSIRPIIRVVAAAAGIFLNFGFVIAYIAAALIMPQDPYASGDHETVDADDYE